MKLITGLLEIKEIIGVAVEKRLIASDNQEIDYALFSQLRHRW